MIDLLIYPLAGALAGLIAGLLGVGGGIVMVPALLLIFASLGVNNAIIMHLALGTSLGIMVFTSLSAFRAHHKRGAVDWQLVKPLAAGVVVGAALSGWIALPIPSRLLELFFASFLCAVAVQMLTSRTHIQTSAASYPLERPLVGVLIGVISGLLGIGGGTLSVPYLSMRGETMTRAVGTASALGWFIAIAGTVGYIGAGWQHPQLPEHSFGFINLKALLILAPITVLFAPLGARLSHQLPVVALKRIFAGFLLVVAVKLLF